MTGSSTDNCGFAVQTGGVTSHHETLSTSLHRIRQRSSGRQRHDLRAIRTAAPPEFDGPGDAWSPELLLCAAVADCFILSFRGVARAAHFDWLSLECRVEGVLEHVGDTTQFTRFVNTARLTVPEGADISKARRLLNRADYSCLIANSLRGVQTLTAEVVSAHEVTDPQEHRGEGGEKGMGLHATPKERHPGAGQLP